MYTIKEQFNKDHDNTQCVEYTWYNVLGTMYQVQCTWYIFK